MDGRNDCSSAPQVLQLLCAIFVSSWLQLGLLLSAAVDHAAGFAEGLAYNEFMRRVAAVCAILACVGGCAQNTPAPPPPQESAQHNLLLITLDTTRADHLGAYGSKTASTPVLDRLAARGVRFDHAIANIPLTRPSHTTLLTGLLPQRHGVWSNGPYRLDPQWPTIAERFQKAGYHTAAVIASFVLARSFGLERGFDVYDDRLRETAGADPEKTADQVSAAAQTMLNRTLQPPFFLWLHFYDPHFPYSPPTGSGYDGEIAFMDQQIGAVLQTLDARALTANTVVVAVGDHGEGLGEHGETTHGYFLYDSVMRVPLIVAGPGVPSGKTIHGTIGLCDLTPTLLDAFQIRKPDDRFDGKSVWKAIQGASLAGETVVLENRAIHHQFGWAALIGLRTDDWKWIGAPEQELYDLRNDPGELINKARDNPTETAAMRAQNAKLRPKSESGGSSKSGLSPEEEAKLASLGYISGGPSDDLSVFTGPDPKHFSDAIGSIDALIHARQEKNMQRVVELVAAVLKLDSQNMFALRCRGEMLIEERRYAEALSVLKQIVGRNENHPETYWYLGTAYEKTGDAAQALVWYEKAASPPWVFWQALESMARLSGARPDLLSREDCMRKIAAVQPSSGRETISVARAYALLAAYQEALDSFRKAIEISPRAPEALVGQAQMLQKLGRLPEAEQSLMRIQNPTVESRYVLATVLHDEGRKDAACTNFVEAFRLQPRNLNLVMGVGAGLQSCGLLDQAADCYQRVLETDSRQADALYRLAAVEEQRGNSGAARSLYKRFLQAAPPQMQSEIATAREKMTANTPTRQ